MRGSEEYNALVEKEIKKTRLARIMRVSQNDNLITLNRVRENQSLHSHLNEYDTMTIILVSP